MKAKIYSILLVIIFLMAIINLQNSMALTGNPSVPPNILWQQKYAKDYSALWSHQSLTNLIETSDEGFAFSTIGFAYQSLLHPATLYKINSTGYIEWTKSLEHFTASTIIQTSDGGYEIAGNWRTPSAYELEPTLLKTDSEGNIQWNQNFTSLPQQTVNGAMIQNESSTLSTIIKTSDGGFAYVDWVWGSIVKTDPNKQIQWIKNVTYSDEKTIQWGDSTFFVPAISTAMCSLIETSDGALAGLGIALSSGTNVYRCDITFIKTEPFLPIPSPSLLPTPMPTPTPHQAPQLYDTLIAPILIVVGVTMVVSLLLYRRHRKTTNLK
jgi:hypothetical protein